VTFVLDTSGSMADDNKLVQAKKALAFCLANLNADDRFEIIRFSTEPEQLFGKLTPASEENVADAQKFVKKLNPEGGTAIFDALHQAMALRPEKNDRPYVVVFITDGMPTVGETTTTPSSPRPTAPPMTARACFVSASAPTSTRICSTASPSTHGRSATTFCPMRISR